MLIDLIHKAVPWQGWDRWAGKNMLNLIDRFEFGDTYAVVFNSGMTVEFPKLDPLLEAVREELELATNNYLDLRILSNRDKEWVTRSRLIAEVKCGPPRDIPALIEAIQIIAATYTLSGEWDEDYLADYRTACTVADTLAGIPAGTRDTGATDDDD